MEFNKEEIIDFLIKAKQNTYAGKKGFVKSSRPNSIDMKYEEDPFLYYDTYVGSLDFYGEEILCVNNKPYWSMNYDGRTKAPDKFNGDFLKEVLKRVPKEYPFRGPLSYKSGDYTYINEVNGDFDWFTGREIIKYKDEVIYECLYMGGTTK